jgi:hypothetical protein
MSGPQPKPVLTGISYGDDSITLQFNQPDGTPDSCTLGLGTARSFYTLTLYGRSFINEEGTGFMDVFFRFRDQAGEVWSLALACPVAEVDEIMNEFVVFSQAFRAAHPKHEAAAFPHTLQQAA